MDIRPENVKYQPEECQIRDSTTLLIIFHGKSAPQEVSFILLLTPFYC